MKKATGKVVSLVLALALVITSFSATFAFAATRTESGEVSFVYDSHKELYLANTNTDDTTVKNAMDDEAYNDELSQVNLSTLLEGNIKLETYDHQFADNIEIAQISVSGDNIVRVSKEKINDDQTDYILNVRSSTGNGDATLNVLFKGELDRDEYDEPVTVRGSAQIKIHLLDGKTAILGNVGSSEPGDGVDSLGGLQKNYTGTVTVDKETYNATTATARVYLPVPDVTGGSALAVYNSQKVYDSAAAAAQAGEKAGTVYVVESTGTRNYLNVPNGDGTFTYGVMDPSVGNSIRLSIYSVKDVTEDGKKTLANDKVVAKETVKVENKLAGSIDEIKKGDGTSAYVNGDNKKTVTLSKSKTYAYFTAAGASVTEIWDATGANINSVVNVTMSDGKVGDLKSSGSVEVEAGTVGNVEGNGVVLGGGSVTSAKAVKGSDLDIEGATVGEVKDAGEVTVSSGEVTGAVSATSVVLDPVNDEENVSVGDVSAANLTIYGAEAAASAKSFVSTAQDATILLAGSKASLGNIDYDYYATTLTLDGFEGTISAPSKATIEGSKIVSVESSYDNETDAVVNGNVAIYEIDLQAGQVRFAGNVKANVVSGGEATMVINAGALEITETVATSNTLKLADAADVTPGTVVFRAATDIADEDSFIGYGYTMRMVSGSSQDAFLVDGVQFAGLTMNVSEADILLGTSETFTASAYPAATQLPEGAYIKFFLNGDENYITGVDNGNGTATIQALKYDSTFSSLNEATLTAYVYDEYDIELEEYGSASVKLNVIEKPKTTYVSDTTGNVDVALGNTYQFKITSTDGSVPSFAVAGDGNIFRLVEQSNSGNDYFFKVQAVGTPGQVCGVYINREATPVATLTVDVGYECDTTTVNVAAGASYIAKVTANEQPVVAAGNSSYTVELASQSGNDYFFRITAVSAQAGDQVGFYINSSAAPVFIATTV